MRVPVIVICIVTGIVIVIITVFLETISVIVTYIAKSQLHLTTKYHTISTHILSLKDICNDTVIHSFQD